MSKARCRKIYACWSQTCANRIGTFYILQYQTHECTRASWLIRKFYVTSTPIRVYIAYRRTENGNLGFKQEYECPALFLKLRKLVNLVPGAFTLCGSESECRKKGTVDEREERGERAFRDERKCIEANFFALKTIISLRKLNRKIRRKLLRGRFKNPILFTMVESLLTSIRLPEAPPLSQARCGDVSRRVYQPIRASRPCISPCPNSPLACTEGTNHPLCFVERSSPPLLFEPIETAGEEGRPWSAAKI